MPHTDDGRRVDILLNLLAIINRTTSFPLYELMLTSITYQIRQKMISMDNDIDREKMFFDFLRIFNEDEYNQIWEMYKYDTDEGRYQFLQDIMYDGIYLHQPPMWEKEPIFYRIEKILEKFPWLKPNDLYIKKWGQTFKTLNKNWIGDIYILKLKQSDRRGFSVRSTGAIDIKGLPTRSYKSRSHLEQTSGTAIRFGEYETLNFSIGLLPEDIVLFHSLYRTSVKGRKDIVKLMFKDPESEEFMDTIDNSYTSRVAEIFEVILKSLSIGLDFIDMDNVIYPINNTDLSVHEINGKKLICTDYQTFLLEKMIEIKDIILEDNAVIVKEDLMEIIESYMDEKNYLFGDTLENILGNFVDAIF